MKVSIDLDNRESKDQALKNINTSWSVTFPPKDFPLWMRWRWLRNLIHVDKRVYVSVKDVYIPSALGCFEEDLFYIQYGTELYKQSVFPVEISLEREITPFQLFIDTSCIFDCAERQGKERKTYPVRAAVCMQDEDGNIIKEEDVEVEVEFLNLQVNPSITMELNEENITDGKLQYNSGIDEAEIGTVNIKNICNWDYSPAITLSSRLHLYINKMLSDDALLLYDKQGNRIPTEIKLKDIRGFNASYVLKLDFTKMTNPPHAVTVAVTNSAKYCLEYEPDIYYPLVDNGDGIFDEERKFTLMPDPRSTELQVSHTFYGKAAKADRSGETSLSESENDIDVPDKDGETSVLARKEFIAGGVAGTRLSLCLLNTATDPRTHKGAGVMVKHLVVSSEIQQGVDIRDKNGRQLRSGDIVRVSGEDYETMASPGGFVINNGKNAKTELHIDFMPAEIDELKNCPSFEFKMLTTVSFDYWENKTGMSYAGFDANKQTFRHTYEWTLFREPNKEWLCVDYGTSAIVCIYDNKIIDLHGQKGRLFRKDPVYSRLPGDTLERGTKYLPSHILFHNIGGPGTDGSSLCSEQASNGNYSELAICLSPTTEMIRTDSLHVLPCLKLLIGHEHLPQVKGFHDLNINYKRKTEGGTASLTGADEALERDEKSAILKVDNVFLEAYSTLFNYFIAPSIKNIRKVNKLILTYPNTYTPLHLNILRTIAGKVFPSIRPGYLRFVAESDAVAAYYMNKWDEYHPGSADMKKDETVLVYDMGAGTLDISVFKKRYDKAEKRYIVEILGKIGSAKGGNYQDSLIARILEKCGVIPPEWASLKRPSTLGAINARPELKYSEMIKIKEQLGKPSDSVILINCIGQTKSFKVSDIVDAQEFKDYIRQVTVDIIGNILNYIDREGGMKIDTVIASGRACKLPAIEESLKNLPSSAGRFRGANVIFPDNPVNGRIAAANERQKSAVCEGAVAYCNLFDGQDSIVRIISKRLYANYGVTYKTFSGKRHYVQLLDHSDKRLNGSLGTVTFDSRDISDFGEGITLIQSYMSERDTLAVLRKYDTSDKASNVDGYEYISEMMYVDRAHISARNVGVRLEIDKENNISMLLNGAPTIKNTPKGIDLKSEVTKMSLWPVAIE